MVEFSHLSKLKLSFKSKVVLKGQEFNANIHISKARVTLRPNAKYFRLDDVSFERVAPRQKISKKPKKATPEAGGVTSNNHPGDGHVGI